MHRLCHLLFCSVLPFVLCELPANAQPLPSIFFATEDPAPGVGTGPIARVGLDGTGLSQDLVPNVSINTGIDIDPIAERVYYLTGSQSINRADLNGLGIEAIVPSPGLPNGVSIWDIAVDPSAQKIYFTNRVGGALARMNLDGTNAEEISPPGVDILTVSLDLANGKVYYTDAAFGTEARILRSDLDGSNPETIEPLELPVFNVGFNPANEMVYFQDTNLNTSDVFVKKMQPDGSGISTVLTGSLDVMHGNLPQLRDFDFVPTTGNLIVSDTLAGEIFTVNADGTGRAPILTGLNEPSQLAIGPGVALAVPALSKWAVLVLALLLCAATVGTRGVVARLGAIGPATGIRARAKQVRRV